MDSAEFSRTAHDLNDVLQLLGSRSEHLLNSLEAWDPLRHAVDEICADIRSAIPLVHKLVEGNRAHLPSHAPRFIETQLSSGKLEQRMSSFDKYKLSDPHKPTLLYIDDKPERLVVLKAVLESTGYRVLTADSGLRGLELFLAEPIDLVILDYYMPSMDGGAVATKMRRLRPNVPIIIFSGALTLPELVIAMVDGYISTSEEPELLLEKIGTLLSHVRATAS
ncbi:MAG: response regulator receiver protein [Acidobacteriales bacterium]|nr:response regulator receiver protein [Terriglobales bacterium]